MHIVFILVTLAAGLLGGLNLGTIFARRGTDSLPAECGFELIEPKMLCLAA